MSVFQKRGRRCFVIATLFALLAVLGIFTYLPVHGEEKIYDSVIRLHVLANSDSEEDQALKLRVRDTVLSLTEEHMTSCDDREEARARLEALLPMLTEAAEATLREAGCDDTVRIELSEEDYPTRNYESFCFPSGRYLSLRVMIGEAAGQNFWCVLFPPLCLSAAASKEEVEEEFIAVGLSREQYAIITETGQQKYRLRFKVLEAFRAWFDGRKGN